MKTKISFFMLIVVGVALMLMMGYTQGNSQVNSTNKLPVLNTFEVEDVLAESATCGGEIISDGGSFIMEKGVCWVSGKKQTAQKSTDQKPPTPNPTITDNKTTDGEGGENFSSYMSGLKPNTTYYVRAYATNSAGTKYGKTMSFTTQGGVIEISTSEVADVLAESATCGGHTISDGGSEIIEKGVCWATIQKQPGQNPSIPTPTIADNKTNDGEGYDSFISSINELSADTKYYVRAYATNSVGTKYGKTMSFTTKDGVIEISTSEVANVSAESATCGGEIISDGGSKITEKGVCWATSQKQPGPKTSIPTPTIADYKTNDGEGYDSFISSINELSANIKYYVRAYATNSVGTSYGNTLSFTTQDGIAEIKNTEEIVILPAAASFKISLTDGGAIINAKGVCWDSSKQTPSIMDNFTNNIEDTSNTFICNIKGLTPSTKYHVRAYATSRFGTVYGDTISFTTQAGITDIDGNGYTTIVIGTQEWMAENLKVTHYQNGDVIPKVTDNSAWRWLTTSAYCNYDNNATNADTYGRLYDWYAVNDSRNIAPEGWHVPSDVEWQTLVDYLGGDAVAGGKMKEMGTTYWNSPNTGATNESGFSALPGGCRYLLGSCYYIGDSGYWWSATEGSSGYAWSRDLSCSSADIHHRGYDKLYGFSVRCIRD